MNAPACASARRPGSSRAFQSGQAWIMCGQISRVVRDVGLAGGGGEADSVVEQGLGRADLDQGRRQPLEIGIERRKARVFPVHSRRDIGLGQLFQVSFLNERIDGAFANAASLPTW